MVKGKSKISNSGYKKLSVYQKSKELVLVIYELTGKFPKTETYTLVPQMRRAAISVVANVVEGYSKESSAEYARFLTISIGSAAELEVFIDISLDLGFIEVERYNEATAPMAEVKRLLYGTRKSVRPR